MRVLVSGSSGLVGKALCAALAQAGHTVVRLVRNDTALSDQAIYWDPGRGVLAGDQLLGFDGVIHLAGESIANGRWTPEHKARIRESRLQGTQLLADRIAACGQPPAFLISASAIGFYGNRGDEILSEDSAPGRGFLAEVCQEWEAKTRRAAEAGVRVVNLRLGMVLSAEGGALAKMLPLFRLGLGGPLGNGAMWVSWIHLDDLVRAIMHCIDTPSLAGPVNAMAPAPLTNRDFARTLGKALHRPAFVATPAPVLRIALGEMADELLLASTRAIPQKLEDSGYTFQFAQLDSALTDILGD